MFIFYGTEKEMILRSSGSARIQYEIAKKYADGIKHITTVSNFTKIFTRTTDISKAKYSRYFLPTKFKWILTNVIWVINHYLMHPIFLKKEVIEELNKYDTVILGSILGASYFKKILKHKLIVLDHNVSWLFTYYTLDNIPLISKFLVTLIRRIELNAINSADEIWVLSSSDARILKEEANNPSKIKVISLCDLAKQYSGQTQGSTDARTQQLELTNILSRLQRKFVIGFVGSLFLPNIIVVRNIIKIASKLNKDIAFLIIGNVSEAFKDQEIPSNVIFTGFVKDIDSYLNICNIFINIKTTFPTGAEIKMLDYLKFNKPVIAMRFGASGFEKCKNVIIVDSIGKLVQEIIRLRNSINE